MLKIANENKPVTITIIICGLSIASGPKVMESEDEWRNPQTGISLGVTQLFNN